MFKNPINKYQAGGSAPSKEQQEMLAAFVQWLPKRVKEFANMQPEQIVEALNEMSKTPEGQKQVQAYMEQFQKEMQGGAGMFKEGGKLNAFVCKHAKGGHMVDCGCKEDGGKVEMNRGGKTIQDGNYEVTVNAPGDTTRTFYNKYNRQVMQTYPDGTIRYSTLSNNENDDFQVNSWVGKPSFLRRLWFGNKQATPEKINSWEQEIASQPMDPRNTDTTSAKRVLPTIAPSLGLFPGTTHAGIPQGVYMEDGGEVPMGKRGFSLFNWFRKPVATTLPELPVISDDIITDEDPEIELPTFENLEISTPDYSLAAYKEPDYDSMSFNKAFAAARDFGANTFMWHGKKYGTRSSNPRDRSQGRTAALQDFNVPEGASAQERSWPLYTYGSNGNKRTGDFRDFPLKVPYRQEGGVVDFYKNKLHNDFFE